MNKMKNAVFFIGFSYTAEALMRQLSDSATEFLATARTEGRARELEARNITPVPIWEGAEAASIPEGADWLVSAPPDDEGCPGYRQFSDQARTARWIGYLSTTGVYGDRNGGWVFEWSEVSPDSPRGERRVKAERQWLESGGPAHVFRLPGIYGPGRSALERLEEGKARRIIKPGQVFSRVHVDDIASCLLASMKRPNPGRAYHPCDDEPAPPQDVIEYAARLLEKPIPPDVPFESADLSPMARSFYAECKRVSNARTKSELGWYPTFADYRDGLKAIDGSSART